MGVKGVFEFVQSTWFVPSLVILYWVVYGRVRAGPHPPTAGYTGAGASVGTSVRIRSTLIRIGWHVS